MKTIEITGLEAGQRLDKFLGKYMSLAPKSFFYKMLRKKNIVLNGKKEPAGSGSGKKPSFSLVYEDENILVLNKPWGMLTQKAKPDDISLNEHMIEWLLDTGRMTKEQLRMQKPSVCNRLDRNTSGIVLAGRSLNGLQGLSRILKDRTGEKQYYALVWGHVKEARQLKGYLVKDTKANQVRVFSDQDDAFPERLNKENTFLPGGVYEAGRKNTENTGGREAARYIETDYRPLGYGGGCTLLEIDLITGRSHQIRAHLSGEGHFIIGDPKYGRQEINREFSRKYGLRGQLLHAGVFVMPTENCPFPGLAGEKFTAPLEPRFVKILDALGISAPEGMIEE